MWDTTTILGGRIIRSLILGVERSQKLFRRRAQRQKMDVRDGVEGKPKVILFSTNEMLGKCWRLFAESPKGMIKTGDLENRNKIGVKEQGVLRTQWEDLKKQFAKKRLGLSIIQKMRWN